MIVNKSPQEIEKMRRSGEKAARVMESLSRMIRPGLKTLDLDRAAARLMEELGCSSAFKGYGGPENAYPAHICVSINEEVVHGIPGERRLNEGDIVSLDVGVGFEGYYGDLAKTFPVGRVAESRRDIIDAAREALERAIEKTVAANRVSDISHAIEVHARLRGYSVVRDFVGHGIGSRLHEDPQVPNFGEPGRGPRLFPGMAIAIEPMLNRGGSEVRILKDGWTVVTLDRSDSAHFEHTVAVTGNGPEVLTW